MPYELAMSDELSRLQFYGRAQQAADEIERLRAEIGELHMAAKRRNQYAAEKAAQAADALSELSALRARIEAAPVVTCHKVTVHEGHLVESSEFTLTQRRPSTNISNGWCGKRVRLVVETGDT